MLDENDRHGAFAGTVGQAVDVLQHRFRLVYGSALLEQPLLYIDHQQGGFAFLAHPASFFRCFSAWLFAIFLQV